MRRTILFGISILLVVVLSGCVYSSANMMRAKGEYIKVFGAWGWVECKNSAVTMYRSSDSISYIKGKQEYPKIPTRPTITEDDMDIIIGKQPRPVTP